MSVKRRRTETAVPLPESTVTASMRFACRAPFLFGCVPDAAGTYTLETKRECDQKCRLVAPALQTVTSMLPATEVARLAEVSSAAASSMAPFAAQAVQREIIRSLTWDQQWRTLYAMIYRPGMTSDMASEMITSLAHVAIDRITESSALHELLLWLPRLLQAIHSKNLRISPSATRYLVGMMVDTATRFDWYLRTRADEQKALVQSFIDTLRWWGQWMFDTDEFGGALFVLLKHLPHVMVPGPSKKELPWQLLLQPGVLFSAPLVVRVLAVSFTEMTFATFPIYLSTVWPNLFKVKGNEISEKSLEFVEALAHSGFRVSPVSEPDAQVLLEDMLKNVSLSFQMLEHVQTVLQPYSAHFDYGLLLHTLLSRADQKSLGKSPSDDDLLRLLQAWAQLEPMCNGDSMSKLAKLAREKGLKRTAQYAASLSCHWNVPSIGFMD